MFHSFGADFTDFTVFGLLFLVPVKYSGIAERKIAI